MLSRLLYGLSQIALWKSVIYYFLLWNVFTFYILISDDANVHDVTQHSVQTIIVEFISDNLFGRNKTTSPSLYYFLSLMYIYSMMNIEKREKALLRDIFSYYDIRQVLIVFWGNIDLQTNRFRSESITVLHLGNYLLTIVLTFAVFN